MGTACSVAENTSAGSSFPQTSSCRPEPLSEADHIRYGTEADDSAGDHIRYGTEADDSENGTVSSLDVETDDELPHGLNTIDGRMLKAFREYCAKLDAPNANSLPGSMELADENYVIGGISRRIKILKQVCDYTTGERNPDLWYIYEACSTHTMRPRIADELVKFNATKIFSKIWQQFSRDPICMSTSNKGILTNMAAILNVFCMCTDQSHSLCKDIVRKGFHEELFSYLDNARFYIQENDILLNGLLVILQNIIQYKEDAREDFRKCRGVEILQKVYKSKNSVMCRSKAIIILAYIINDSENKKINSKNENIVFIIDVLHDALESKIHESLKYGYRAEGVLAALNKLASNDSNKTRIVKEGALPYYVKLLQQDCSVLEQKTAATGIWILSFKCKDKIRKEPGCIEALRALKSSNDDKVRKEATGALWSLEERNPSAKPAHHEQRTNQGSHIMISYQWDCQKVMLKLRDKLQKKGYKVWIDVDKMRGLLLDGMAKAVQEAQVVIVAVSYKYKISRHCHTEADYAYELGKPFVPVMVEKGYKPTDWLGAMLGTTYRIDISSNKLKDALPRIQKEIQNKMTASNSGNTPDFDTVTPERAPQTFTAVQIPKDSVEGWTEADVLNWLDEIGLSAKRDYFKGDNGKSLLWMQETLDRAPEFYHATMRDEKHFDMNEIKLFNAALKHI